MNTSFWGKDGWKLTHSIAYSYDEKNTVCYDPRTTNLVQDLWSGGWTT